MRSKLFSFPDLLTYFVTSHSDKFGFAKRDLIGYDVYRVGQCLKHQKFMKDLKIISFFIPCKNGYIITLKFLYRNLITVQCFSFSWKVINVGYMGFKRFKLWFSWDLLLPVCQGCLQEVWYFNELYGHLWKNILSIEMSGRPRTTSFAEGNKQQPNPPLGGMKISSKCSKNWAWFVGRPMSDDQNGRHLDLFPHRKFT